MACPYCAEAIPDGGGYCPHCKSELASPARRPLAVDHTFAWTILATPLVAFLLNVAFPAASPTLGVLVAAVLNVVLATRDDKHLRAAGYPGVSALWAFILVPVYLFLRARQVGVWAIPFLWVLLFLVYLAAASAAGGSA